MDEIHLTQNYERIIVPHFRNVFAEKTFEGVRGKKIRYIEQKHITSENALVILGGRTEFVEKYAELFYDLRRMDASIYSYDHRGQGLSDRLLDDSHKGHVAHFSEYIEDLRIFLTEVVEQYRHKRIVVLAFSMGAAITALFQQINKEYISAAILCSPMFTINSFPLPQSLVRWIANKSVELGFGENYIPGGRPYNFSAKFNSNVFTSSKIRYQINHNLVREVPGLALGSPTFNWLREALLSSTSLLDRAGEIDIPILLLQSGNDRVVKPDAQNVFCEKAANCKLHIIDNARHEMLMERDIMRGQVIGYITNFLNTIIPGDL